MELGFLLAETLIDSGRWGEGIGPLGVHSTGTSISSICPV